MEQINQLLKHIQKTNPDMTKEKLLEELGKSRYSAVALIMVWQNSENRKSMSA